MTLAARLQSAFNRLSPRQRQWAMLGALMTVGVGSLWAVFAFADSKASTASTQGAGATSGKPAQVTNIGVMTPGQQVTPLDQWVGTAGKKLAQYDSDKQEQAKVNADRKSFEDNILKRFAELEQKQTANAIAQIGAGSNPAAPGPAPTPNVAPPAPTYPPSSSLSGQNLPAQPPAPRGYAMSGMPAGTPGMTTLAEPATDPDSSLR
jgi:conjugal transfer pilus assembly protein TraB